METKLFGRYSAKDVKLQDQGIARYLDLSTPTIPHSFGRQNKKGFEKSKIPAIERLINKLMKSGQGKRKLSGKYIRKRGGCGKKLMAMKAIDDAFKLIEKEKLNPLQVFAEAIENTAPREDTTRFKKGGVAQTQSVDVSPLKRIDESIKNIAVAAFQQSFKSKVTVSEALAKELMLAAKQNNQSFAVKRRDEVERIAQSSR